MILHKQVPIFAAGDYGPRGNWTPERVKGAVERFNASGHEAPVTVDHKKTGPAWGWASNLNFSEGIVRADLALLPEFNNVVERGAFKKRSVEWYPNDDQPGLRAVTFLGAQPPVVKGLTDIAFAEGAEPICFGEIEINLGAETVIPECGNCFWPANYMPETDPFPGTHETIVDQGETHLSLGHFHAYYVDRKGTGFTSPPFITDAEGKMAVDPSGHVHRVTRFITEPNEGPTPPAHVHSIGKYQEFSEHESHQETHNMAGNTAPNAAPATAAPAATVDFSETPAFKAMQAEIKAQGEKLAAAEARLADTQQGAEFAVLFSELEKNNRATPAMKAPLRKLFDAVNALPATVDFAEGDATVSYEPKAAFKEFIAALPSRDGLFQNQLDASAVAFSEDRNSAPADGKALERRAHQLQAEAKKAGKTIDFGEAIIAADEEIRAKAGAV